MYIARTKKNNGMLIVEGDNRYYVSWEELESLRIAELKADGRPPIKVIKALPKGEKYAQKNND